MPVDEQFDKEKAQAEVLALDNVPNDKPASTPNMPQLCLTDAEKDKCEGELAKLYKQLDDKVRETGHTAGVATANVYVINCTLFPILCNF